MASSAILICCRYKKSSTTLLSSSYTARALVGGRRFRQLLFLIGGLLLALLNEGVGRVIEVLDLYLIVINPHGRQGVRHLILTTKKPGRWFILITVNQYVGSS